jgi:divalent metal cation (Fe/Co/Zn/Cd) transporter
LRVSAIQNTSVRDTGENRLFKAAFALALFTIAYNIAEAAASLYFGFSDESFTLFGFGLDSLIEVVSGTGIAAMIVRLHRNPESHRGHFEKTALKITGTSFYLLSAGLLAIAVYNLVSGHKPETTTWGIIVAVASIVIMWALIIGKRRIGRKLGSEAIMADAECTKVCLYMSLVLLFSSALYSLTGIGFAESIGTLGLAFLSLREGRECFEKAASDKYCVCED